MKTKHLNIKIEGISPLLMHRFPLEPVTGFDKLTPEEQCEISAYRTSDKKLYIPGINIQRALISGATYVKGKGRASLAKPAAACMLVPQEHLILDNPSYTVDSRAVVNPSTKGRIVRHRPKLETWRVSFPLDYDPELISAAQVREIVDLTGIRVGLLDFRPETKGPFGRFKVIKWEDA